MKKLMVVFTMVVMMAVAFIAKAGFDTYSGHKVTELMTAQQFYSVTTGAINYSTDYDMKEYTGTCQFMLDSALGTQASTGMAVKIQSSDLAVGASYTTVGATDNILLSGATTNAKLAASFTQVGVRQIKSVQLRLKQIGTVADAKYLTLAIYADSTGPTGSALATAGTVLAKNVSKDGYAPILFTFATPYAVANNTKYWLVLTADYDASGTNAIEWRTNTLVSGGNFAKYDESWAAVATKSAEFAVNQYNFVDVTGGAFATVSDTANNGVQTLGINKDNIGQFIRSKVTLTGNYPTFIASLVVDGQLKTMVGP